MCKYKVGDIISIKKSILDHCENREFAKYINSINNRIEIHTVWFGSNGYYLHNTGIGNRRIKFSDEEIEFNKYYNYNLKNKQENNNAK